MLERWVIPRCGVCLKLQEEGCECEQKFSKDFCAMLAMLDVEKIIEGSHVMGANFEIWEANRRFLAEAIDRDGTILDIGCANGFLLRSMQEWTEHRLNPYGIDTNAKHIKDARIIFPRAQDHFAEGRMEDLEKHMPQGFPQQMDYCVWNMWDDLIIKPWDKAKRDLVEIARGVLKPDGRLIIACYHHDKKMNEAVSDQLEAEGYVVKELPNTYGQPECAYIIDNDDQKDKVKGVSSPSSWE